MIRLAGRRKGDYVLDKRHASLLVKIAHLAGFSPLRHAV